MTPLTGEELDAIANHIEEVLIHNVLSYTVNVLYREGPSRLKVSWSRFDLGFVPQIGMTLRWEDDGCLRTLRISEVTWDQKEQEFYVG